MILKAELYLIAGETDGLDGEQLWWSNVVGWASLESATIFSAEERQDLRLPFGGSWVRFASQPEKAA